MLRRKGLQWNVAKKSHGRRLSWGPEPSYRCKLREACFTQELALREEIFSWGRKILAWDMSKLSTKNFTWWKKNGGQASWRGWPIHIFEGTRLNSECWKTGLWARNLSEGGHPGTPWHGCPGILAGQEQSKVFQRKTYAILRLWNVRYLSQHHLLYFTKKLGNTFVLCALKLTLVYFLQKICIL